MAGMLLPALSKAKGKASRIKSVNNLKQIGLSAKVFANQNGDRFPVSFDEMMNEIGSQKVLIDPDSGLKYVYVGVGKSEEHSDAIIAYSPVDVNGRNVVFADGSVQMMSSEAFSKALQRDAEILQQMAVQRSQQTQVRATVQNLQDQSTPAMGNAHASLDQLTDKKESLLRNYEESQRKFQDIARQMHAAARAGSTTELAKLEEDVRKYGGEHQSWLREIAVIDGKINKLLEATGQLPRQKAEATVSTEDDGSIRPGESLQLIVTEDSSLNGIYQVRSAGYIILPRAGQIYVVGKTPMEAEQMLKKSLEKTLLRVATVTVERISVSPRMAMGGAVFSVGPPPTAQSVGGLVTNMTSAPTAVGLRSIRIDIPRSGRQFSFTKVLNLKQEPLSISMAVQPLSAHATVQWIGQVGLFFVGLGFAFMHWLRSPRKTLFITIGLAVAVYAVLWKSTSSRTLHWLFILGFPFAGTLLLAWIGACFWPRRGGARRAESTVPGAQTADGKSKKSEVRSETFGTSADGEAAPHSPPPIHDSSVANPKKVGRARKKRGSSGGSAATILLATLLGASPVSGNQYGHYAAPGDSGTITLTTAKYRGTVSDKTAAFDVELLMSNTGTNQLFNLFSGDVAVQEFTVHQRSAGFQPARNGAPGIETSDSTKTDIGNASTAGGGGSVRSKTGAGGPRHPTGGTPAPRVVREGANVRLWFPEPGKATIQLRLLVSLDGDAAKRQLKFGLPPALASDFELIIPEPDAAVEFPTAVTLQREVRGTNTTVKAVIGAADRVDLTWTPRLKKLAEMEATVFVENLSAINLGGGVVNTRSLLNYQILQGEIGQAKVRLPFGQRLLRVDGQSIRTWEIHREGEQEVLTVDLIKGVTQSYTLTIETEKALGNLPADVSVLIPHVTDVRRETGLIGLTAGEEIALTVGTANNLQRVDTAEFDKAAAKKLPKAGTAYRYFKPGFELTVHAETVVPELEAVSRNHFRLGYEMLHLTAGVDFNIRKAGLFNVQLEAPTGWKIDSVRIISKDARGRVATRNAPWTEKTTDGKRRLDVRLPERTMGVLSLRLELSQLVQQLPATMTVAGIHPVGMEKHRGFVTVNAESGIAVKTGAFAGLTEVPPQTVPTTAGIQNYYNPGGAPVLAFKFIDATPRTSGDWSLTVGLEQLESWVRAEVANFVSAGDTLLSGRAIVILDIANAPLKEFQLKIPTTVTNVDITGVNIRRRDQNGETWRVELQNKLRGKQTFTVTWEQPRTGSTSTPIDIPVINAPGVERETGFVALLAKPPLQVTEGKTSDGLIRIDSRELPPWAGVSANGTVGAETVLLAYRYLRPGFALTAKAQRFDEAAVLQAIVDDARLTTIVADDGQMMTEVKLRIRNNGKQFIELRLPGGSSVWSAFVDGQAVRPSKQGNMTLLPLEQSSDATALLEVEFTYVGADKFPKTRGDVALQSPTIDVPLKNAQWDVYLPPDYEFTGFEGTMKREEEVAQPVRRSFDYESYLKVEIDNRARDERQGQVVVSNIRSNLKGGNLAEANKFLFKNANNPNNNGIVLNRELSQVKKELTKAQARNFVQSQRAYTLNNNDLFNGQGQGGQGGQGFNAPAQQLEQMQQPQSDISQFEEVAAEQQVLKLQLAQQVETVNVQPLRVNLPTRGQKHTFTQVLQTEINKPMTIEFEARNLKKEGSFKWFALAGFGFLILWLVVARISERNEASEHRM